MAAIVELREVSVRFRTAHGWGYAVTAVTADIAAGQVTAIIGESGSGKSVLGAAIMGLLPYNAELRGSIRFAGRELVGMADRDWDLLRGSELGWVAQNPLSALNPAYRIDELLAETAIRRRRIRRRQKAGFANRLLNRVALPNGVARRYSFELSGGMAQRALIATGLGLEPGFLILDEPTKGLDPGNVRRVRSVIAGLAAAGRSLLVITHDVTLAEQVADEVWVFYGSRLVEQAPARRFFAGPGHPYSRGLIAALPSRGMHPIPGESPSFYTVPHGCPFAERCQLARPGCRELTAMQETKTGSRMLCLAH